MFFCLFIFCFFFVFVGGVLFGFFVMFVCLFLLFSLKFWFHLMRFCSSLLGFYLIVFCVCVCVSCGLFLFYLFWFISSTCFLVFSLILLCVVSQLNCKGVDGFSRRKELFLVQV